MIKAENLDVQIDFTSAVETQTNFSKTKKVLFLQIIFFLMTG